MSYKAVDFFIKSQFYSIEEIKIWFDENSDYYQECKLHNQIISCYKDLPCNCVFDSFEYKFQKVYDLLGELIQYSLLNSYAEKEIDKFQDIKNDKIKVGKWLKDNENEGLELYLIFLSNYFEFDTDGSIIIDNLKVNLHIESVDFIYVNVLDFIKVINFALLFKKIIYESNKIVIS